MLLELKAITMQSDDVGNAGANLPGRLPGTRVMLPVPMATSLFAESLTAVWPPSHSDAVVTQVEGLQAAQPCSVNS